MVEHLTFNQVVRGSTPRCFTLRIWRNHSDFGGLRYFYSNLNRILEILQVMENLENMVFIISYEIINPLMIEGYDDRDDVRCNLIEAFDRLYNFK